MELGYFKCTAKWVREARLDWSEMEKQGVVVKE
jgi:hypothetical protein